MKAVFAADKLKAAIAVVSRVIGGRGSSPICRSIKITVDADGKANLQATDMEIWATASLQATDAQGEIDDIKPGCCCVNADMFGQIVGKSSSDKIAIHVGENSVDIWAGRGEYSVQSCDWQSFPSAPAVAGDSYMLSALAVGHAIGVCEPSSSGAVSGKFALGGILLEMDGKSLVVACSDGRRMTRHLVEYAGETHGKGFAITLPKKAAKALTTAISDAEKAKDADESRAMDPLDLRIRANESCCVLDVENVSIVASLVQGRPLPWRPFEADLKKCTETIASVVSDLLGVVRQAEVCVDDESKAAIFSFSKTGLTIETNIPMVGRAKVSMPTLFAEKKVDILLNPAYVIAFLSKLEAELPIEISIQDPNKPVFFVQPTSGALCAIMPLVTKAEKKE